MANLYTGVIKTNGEYKKVSELTGITFTTGTDYTIQIQNSAYIREGTIGDGFFINNSNPFAYKSNGEDLYIKVDYGYCVINIAD